ncbi:MAG: tRNA (adenosine(37)-N6)-threonylcarbamoyltransferase complex ATPase subunit type 1 TsaE [Methylophilaceae bacterium]
MTSHFTLELVDEAATLEAGCAFSKQLNPGMVVYLHGDLGAGKTTFVRGVLQGFGHKGKVKSPTYTLVEPYVVSRYSIYHFDLYRFIDENEWDAAGFNEYFNGDSICMVEWPEKAGNILPKPDFDVKLNLLNDYEQSSGRKLTILAQ